MALRESELCATTQVEPFDDAIVTEEESDREPEMCNQVAEVGVPTRKVCPPRVASLAQPRNQRRKLHQPASLTVIDSSDSEDHENARRSVLPAPAPRNRSRLEVDFNFYQKQMEKKRLANDRQLKAILAEVSAQRERIAHVMDSSRLEERQLELKRKTREDQRARDMRIRQRMERMKSGSPIVNTQSKQQSPVRQPIDKSPPPSTSTALPSPNHSLERKTLTPVKELNPPELSRSGFVSPLDGVTPHQFGRPPIHVPGQGPIAEAKMMLHSAKQEAERAHAAKRAADELVRSARIQLLEAWREESGGSDQIKSLLTMEMDTFDTEVTMIQRFLFRVLSVRRVAALSSPPSDTSDDKEVYLTKRAPTDSRDAFPQAQDRSTTLPDAYSSDEDQSERRDYARLVVTNITEAALLDRLRELCRPPYGL